MIPKNSKLDLRSPQVQYMNRILGLEHWLLVIFSDDGVSMIYVSVYLLPRCNTQNMLCVRKREMVKSTTRVLKWQKMNFLYVARMDDQRP